MFWLFFVSRIVLYNFQTYIEYKEKLYQNNNLRLRELSVIGTESVV